MPTGIYNHINNHTNKGKPSWNAGIKTGFNSKHSEIMKQKYSSGEITVWNKNKKTGLVPKSAFKKGQMAGEKHFNWKGGVSRLPYSIDWTITLKRSIRERDKYMCRICGEPQGDISLDVHHIDYNKENCNPDNLVTLCKSCHTKTNFNRDSWKEYFNKLLNNK
jgi:hypothetical protein